MIEIQIANDQFLPGQEIAGEVRWADLKESDRIEVRLIWYTSGKGTRDLEIVHVHPVDSVPVSYTHLTLPTICSV